MGKYSNTKEFNIPNCTFKNDYAIQILYVRINKPNNKATITIILFNKTCISNLKSTLLRQNHGREGSCLCCIELYTQSFPLNWKVCFY